MHTTNTPTIRYGLRRTRIRTLSRCGTALALLLSASSISLTAANANTLPVVNIQYYYPVGVSGPLASIMTSMVKTFNNQHPSIHVDAIFSGSYADTLTKLEAAISAGSPPAVAVVNHVAAYDLVHLNAVEPLDAVAAQGDFYPALLAPRVKGHIWGIPFQRSTVVLYYNETAFAKSGLNPSTPPTSWSQLVTDGKALEKHGYTGIEVPSGGTGEDYWQFDPFVLEAGGQNLFNTNGTQTYFNSPGTVRALTFLYDLSHVDHIEPPGLLPWQDVPSDFESGKVGMIVHSSGSLAAILAGSKFKVGEAFMPKGVGKDRTIVGGGDLYLLKGTPSAQRNAGLVFIKWMSAPAQAARWSIDTGYVPTTPRALALPEWTRYVAKYPVASVAVDQLPFAGLEMETYDFNETVVIFDNAAEAILDGSRPVKSALDSAQSSANAILAAYRSQA